MSNFMFALKKELFKLVHKRKYIVLTIIGVLISLGRWGGSALIAKLSNGYVNIKANIGLEMLPFAVEILIPVIIFMAVSDLFTHEYSSDTLKMSLLQPVSRFKLLSAKAAAVLVMSAVILLIMYVVNTAIQIFSGGNSNNTLITLAAYIIDIIPLIGVAFLGVLINVSLKGPTSATLLSLAVYGVMKYMGLYVSGADSFLFTASAKLHIMLLGQPLPLHVIMYKFGILAGSILILYSLSYIIFERKTI